MAKPKSELRIKEDVTETFRSDTSGSKLFLTNLHILLDFIENLELKFSTTDIYIEIKHGDNVIGVTDKKFVINKKFVNLNYDIYYAHNNVLPKELDKLASMPLYFAVWQTKNQDASLYPIIETIQKEDDAILSDFEPILGTKDTANFEKRRTVRVSKKDPRKKSKDKSDKKEKSEKSVRTKLDSKRESRITANSFTLEETAMQDPICIGGGTLDLLPLFIGETEIEETVTIYQNKLHIDERFKHGPTCPQLSVRVCVLEPIIKDETKRLTNIFTLTMEAMYNIPEIFYENIHYKIATVYPLDNLELNSICLTNGTLKDSSSTTGQVKLWANLADNVDNLSAQTKYVINPNPTSIKNETNINVKEIIKSKVPKIVWNSMKQTWLTEDSNEFLRKLITRYRYWPFEIFFAFNMKGSHLVDKEFGGKDKKSKSEKKSTSSKESKKGDRNATKLLIPTHYMAIADLSSLLYPGVKKTRVACEIRTFKQHEFTAETGYGNSYFSPVNLALSEVGVETPEKRTTEISIKMKHTKEKMDKKHKKPSVQDENILEPSEPLLDSNGNPAFLIIEAELMNAFFQPRSIEDLTHELLTLLPHREPIPKNIIPIKMAVDMYKNTICEMIKTINRDFQRFTKECNIKKKEIHTPCFIKYLQNKGLYQKLMVTIGRAIAMLVKEKFKYNFNSDYLYDNYISMIYVYLINEMNKEINNIMSCNITGCISKKIADPDYLYVCEEAIELQMPHLAEKYHLQIIRENTRSPDHWIKLAIFYKSQNLFDRAFECCKEVLALKTDHKYGLLLFGSMLYEKEEYILAETAFLALVHHYPDSIESWVGLYIIYYFKTRYEGCDICIENIEKYKNYKIRENKTDINDNTTETLEDLIFLKEPLAWSTQIAANTPFFQSALIFIKIFALQMAEQAILFDKVTKTGEHCYYLGVIQYYRRDYTEALNDLKEAQKRHGPDYAVNSMIGHCNFRLGLYDKSREAYEFVVCAFDRPEDMHLLYTNLALIYERENNYEMARKYMLIICKMSPTPYSWLLLGVIFYKEDKLKEAEACINESNILDNRLPETWAYLVLINLKLNRVWEAKQCFSQMMKYELQDKSLLTIVVLEMQKATENSK